MGVPKERADTTYKLIIDGAASLGLLQEIKTKKYVNLSRKASGIASPSVNDVQDHRETEDQSALPEANAGNITTIPNQADVAQPMDAVAPASNKKVFITHGRNKGLVDPIRKLLAFGEMEAIVSVERQSVSQPVPEKVMNDMRVCGAAIIHVEGEMTLIDAEAKEHVVLNPNVLIEIGAAMALYGKKFILLVKEGVKLPSNLQGLYEVRYEGDAMDGNATIRLLEAINQLKAEAK